MISAVQMTSGWYAKVWPECDTIGDVMAEEGENLQIHIDSGNVVAFADDIETLAHNMGVSESEITIVSDDDDDD